MNSQAGWMSQVSASVGLEIRGVTAIVTLDRPAKRNALSDELVESLQTLFATVPDGISCIVLRGAGGNFCSGLDLNELKETSITESFVTGKIGQRLNDTIQFCKVPVIAVLEGAVIGGGLELASAAHIRVSDSSAYFALPEATRGIFLGSGGTVRLSRLVGVSTVMEMMLSGRVYGAEDGYRLLRLSHYLVEPETALAKALELAEKIAGNAPLANFGVIQALPRIVEQDPQSGLFTEMLMAGIAQADEEAKRRLRDFLDRKMNKVSRT